MISRKKRNKVKRPTLPIRTISERPKRLFAVGDIHGCLDELNVLLEFLRREQGIGQDDQLIFIGDYIDRGPASKQVLDRLIELKTEHPKTVFLRGNHEDMLLSYLGRGGREGEVYLSNGGFEFFRSYRIQPLSPISEIIAQLPIPHQRFLSELEVGVMLAEFLFVHAGIRPGVPLAEQAVHDLIWIRSAFTTEVHDVGRTVVFGHTPYEDVLIHLPYKIGIDTGLVYGNKLSCVELVDGQLLQVEFGEQDVKVASLKDRLGSRTE